MGSLGSTENESGYTVTFLAGQRAANVYEQSSYLQQPSKLVKYA